MEVTLKDAQLSAAIGPLFEALPMDQAMKQLVVRHGRAGDVVAVVERIIAQPAVARHPALVAGLWLYVDELDRSHDVSQSMPDATGSYWHGIMHRREGDFGNSHYWFRRTGQHPAMAAMTDYDGHAFVDEVEAAVRSRDDASVDACIARQRAEWVTLFAWCAERAGSGK